MFIPLPVIIAALLGLAPAVWLIDLYARKRQGAIVEVNLLALRDELLANEKRDRELANEPLRKDQWSGNVINGRADGFSTAAAMTEALLRRLS